MNGKIVGAFISGAVLASGIVYMAVRPTALPRPTPAADSRQMEVHHPPASSKPAVGDDSAPSQPSAPQLPPKRLVRAPNPTPQRARLSEKPIREKQSPMPPARHDLAVQVPRNQPTHPDQTPAPVPQAAPEPPQTAGQSPLPQRQSSHEPEVVPVQPPVVASSTPIPEVREPHTVILAAGTQLMVRIGETVSAARNQIGDTFFATLEQPLVIDGFIICERGSRVIGKVTQATPAGRAGAQSHLSLELTRLNTSDRQRVDIRTDAYSRDGLGTVGNDLAKIGAGTAVGAAIGAMAGGGKGAAVGAGAGAAAGTAVVLISSGRSVEVPVEARVTFRVKEPVTITEKLN